MICWAHVSFDLTVVTQTAGAFETESSGAISAVALTAVVVSLTVEVAVVVMHASPDVEEFEL